MDQEGRPSPGRPAGAGQRSGAGGPARRDRDGRDLHLRSKKQCRAVVWTAYSRRQGRVVAHLIGDTGVTCAIGLYRKLKQAVPAVALICTDANSCYRLAFERYRVPEPHVQGKANTHRIESSNASIRDNLARFNRRSKRYSKSWEMLEATLLLFFNRHRLKTAQG
ncbi:IS1 family transposase [Corallococcus sp. AB045]|uniref:IS1 family transposase n=1 Tax=Corallococcus sp. AB045 TaxID=2316719 RepID=UPI0018F6FD2F|nr:IS1 family transposase [Corallococcus sp. AB045]